ncbi:MAG: 50S ribosome-binding GTPase, partial [Treponema sp.]|nr:50S ribosome-binding GTPase [Treponema sp.]
MAKQKKSKPDFSKPKPVKINIEEERIEEKSAETERKAKAASDEFGQIDKNATEELTFTKEKTYLNLPLVVIAGRPNVGKSTLFNRFMRRRLAIVDPTPGVTRDPVEATAFIAGKPVHLVDTGGYKVDRDIGTMEAVMDE